MAKDKSTETEATESTQQTTGPVDGLQTQIDKLTGQVATLTDNVATMAQAVSALPHNFPTKEEIVKYLMAQPDMVLLRSFIEKWGR